MKLIVGLGNPGDKFETTRHNIGFLTLNKIQEMLIFPKFSIDPNFQAEISVSTYENQKILLLKPITYMNLSGQAVKKVFSYYKIKLNHIIVIYDDLDLPLGTVRYRQKGSPGTHKGMKSIVTELESQEIQRIRLGIENRDHLQKKNFETKDYVLSHFHEEEKVIVQKAIQNTFTLLKTHFI